ncbi:ASPIC/UnbV domain-containing protein, partial [Novipirellula maiorica]|uniref:ASPIC/UnbV domain-containing protein n=1 Tax=Novipirellula maiorica TaxID=1265734 RepID=UPI000593AC12
LFAGNGYQCASERCVRFGLAASSAVERVSVLWPSGTREEFGPLRQGGEYVLCEGSGEAFQLLQP